MKKYIAVIIMAVLCSGAFAIKEPINIVKVPVILVKDKITVDEATGSTTTENKIADYVDEQTVKVTTTITTTPAAREIKYDKAVLQTELDHLPDRRAEIQKQMDECNAREAELIKMLEVFK